MPVILDSKNQQYHLKAYESEKDFEQDVVAHSSAIFGDEAIYIDVKKRMTGNKIVTIPDGYVLDLSDVHTPRLYIVENEIVSHDAFRHIGIQLLKFVTSFEDAQFEVKAFLMEAISRKSSSLEQLTEAAKDAGARNIDSYLESAVYSEFRGLVIIDESREELRQVLKRINADISVLEFKRYASATGELMFEFDPFYETDPVETSTTVGDPDRTSRRAARRQRRGSADTIVVPAREEGFQSQFLGQNRWFSIRIGAGRKAQLKYIAAYQIAPISAVTHIAEIDKIVPYEDTGKYLVSFKGAAEKIKPIPIRESKGSPQSPVYVRRDKLLDSEFLEDAMTP